MSATSRDALNAELIDRVSTWFLENARELPWRLPATSPWGIFLSEVMSQQTPVARVAPIWADWMTRWPTPAALASAPAGDAVRHWGRLGYPRRALRLHEAASVMTRDFDGEVPQTYEELLTLPGVGDYTAAAVASFAFGQRVPVIDTNIRRFEVRAVVGEEFPRPSLSALERKLAERLLPTEGHVVWNAGSMEFGAVICTARAPLCNVCPVHDLCAWQLAGRPAYDGPARKGQAWAGTDRMVRGKLLDAVRKADFAVSHETLTLVWDDETQRERCLDSLVADGLLDLVGEDSFALPGHSAS